MNKSKTYRFLSDENAQGTAEYVFILAIIVVASYALISLFSDAWVNRYEKIKTTRTGPQGMLP
jgi:Flp pilus assembly pilin Flp